MGILVTRHNRKTDPKEEGCARQNGAVNTLTLKIQWFFARSPKIVKILWQAD